MVVTGFGVGFGPKACIVYDDDCLLGFRLWSGFAYVEIGLYFMALIL